MSEFGMDPHLVKQRGANRAYIVKRAGRGIFKKISYFVQNKCVNQFIKFRKDKIINRKS